MTLPSTSLYKYSHWCCDSLYYLEADPRSQPAHWVHQEMVCVTASEYFYPDTFSPNPLRPCGLALYSVLGGCRGFLVWRRLWFCTLISCVGGAAAFLPCFVSSDTILELQMAARNCCAFWGAPCGVLPITLLRLTMPLLSQEPLSWDLPFLDHIINKNDNDDLSKTYIVDISCFLSVVYTLRGPRENRAVCRGPEFSSWKETYNFL